MCVSRDFAAAASMATRSWQKYDRSGSLTTAQHRHQTVAEIRQKWIAYHPLARFV